MGTDFHLDDRLSTAPQHTGSCRPGRTYQYFKTAASSRGAFDSAVRTSSNDFTDDGLEPKVGLFRVPASNPRFFS
jgi:hypothetical protein